MIRVFGLGFVDKGYFGKMTAQAFVETGFLFEKFYGKYELIKA